MPQPPSPIVVIGGGPAGLAAAEVLARAGLSVDLYDAMPSVGRKFLLAGVGGMNITHSEPREAFLSRYREARPALQPHIEAFDADALRGWIHELGIDTFVGSSGRVFPTDMKAAPLLRACRGGRNVSVGRLAAGAVLRLPSVGHMADVGLPARDAPAGTVRGPSVGRVSAGCPVDVGVSGGGGRAGRGPVAAR